MTIKDARSFAEFAHLGQTRKGVKAEPYRVHLEDVATLVAGFGGSEDAVMAAWLHDTVEDCDVSPAELVTRFGTKVAALVAELTDDKALPKARRKALQILSAPEKSPTAALVKICDKLSNVKAVGVSPPADWPIKRQSDYVNWAETVVAALPPVTPSATNAFAQQVAMSRAAIAQRAFG